MDYLAIIVIAVALAMDAFSVSICSGMVIERPGPGHYFRIAASFGLFQFMMPVIGYFGGQFLGQVIANYDHWVAFGLLAFIGGRMIRESLGHHDEATECVDPSRGMRLLVLAVATSIDALAVGLSFGLLRQPIVIPSIIIGLVCAAFSVTGITLGRRIGTLVGHRAEALGGIMLLAIGIKILIEHMGT